MAVFSIPWCPQYASLRARMVAPGRAAPHDPWAPSR